MVTKNANFCRSYCSYLLWWCVRPRFYSKNVNNGNICDWKLSGFMSLGDWGPLVRLSFGYWRRLNTLESYLSSLLDIEKENLFEFSLIHASCLQYDDVHCFLSVHPLHANLLNAGSCGADHVCLSCICPNTFKCSFKVEQHLFSKVNLVSHTRLRLHMLQFCRCASDKGIERCGLQVFYFVFFLFCLFLFILVLKCSLLITIWHCETRTCEK